MIDKHIAWITWDEIKNIVKQGKNVIKAHLEHLKNHGETGFLKQAADYLKENGIENQKLPSPLTHLILSLAVFGYFPVSPC